jgi:hypothetical protein
MKIAVAITSEPFQQTPEQRLAEQLVAAFERRGEQSQLIKLPIDCRDADAFAQSLLALRLLHLRNVDRLVALDFPACSIQHEDKCAWLIKDLDGEGPGPGDSLEQTSAIRHLLKRTYQAQLHECTRLVDSIPQNRKSASVTAELKVPRLEIQICENSDEALSIEEWDRIAQFLATESAGGFDPHEN